MAGLSDEEVLAKTQSKGLSDEDVIAKTAKKSDAPKVAALPKKERSLYDLMPDFGAQEGALAIGSGMVAPVAGQIAGLGQIPIHAFGTSRLGKALGLGDREDPGATRDRIQAALTYEPRSEQGKLIAEYNPLTLAGKGFGWLGDKAEQITAPPGSGPLRTAAGQGVGEVTRQLPALLGARAPEIAGTPRVPGGPAPTGVAKTLEAGAERSMRSAMKPSLPDRQSGKSTTAVHTMLDEGLNVTKGGAETMQLRVDALNSRVASVIDRFPDATIDKAAVGKHVSDVINKYMNQIDNATDVATIQRIWKDFLSDPMLPDKIPAAQAQAVKQGTYRSLGDKAYGADRPPAASRDTQKAMARAIKEEIEKSVPQVAPLNAELSRLLPALKITERRILQRANNNLIGMGWIASSAEKLMGFLLDKSDLFKSILGRMLHGTAQSLPGMGRAAQPMGVLTSGAAHQIPPPPQEQ